MSKTGWIYFGEAVSRPTLDALLSQLFAQGAFWLGTSPLCADLGRADDGAAVAILPNAWPSARVFTARAEVRWERTPARSASGVDLRCRVWLLTEDAALPQPAWGGHPVGAGWAVAAPAPAIRLWGQYHAPQGNEPDGWVEVRIPRRLNYPVPAASRQPNAFATVSHLEYRAANGAVQWTRLMEVL